MSISSSSCSLISCSSSDNAVDFDEVGEVEALQAETGNDLVHASQLGNENNKQYEADAEAPMEGVDEAPAATQASQGVPRKRRRGSAAPATTSRQTSIVWHHFDKYKQDLYNEGDGKKTYAGFEWRATCRHCGTDFKANSNFNGTSTLKRHIEKVCKMYPGREIVNDDDGQQHLVGDGEAEPKLTQQKPWSVDRCTVAACEMIVIDELPFSHVEKEGFRHFCSVAVPKFVPPSRRTIVRCFWKLYDEKKDELRKVLSSHRVCLTTDTWTSVQNINYMVLTAHFIDAGWNLHKRIINFCVIPNHKGATIGRILESCLLRWKIDKVLTISVDNASANKVAIDYIRAKMAGWKYPPVFEGKYIHIKCFSHVVNIIVKAGLSIVDKSCAAIRNAVKYIRSSSSRLDVFKVCMEKETLEGNVETEKIPALDLPTRWNSTFLMLDIALQVRPAFERMEREEMNKYRSYFDEEEEPEEDEETEIQVVTRRERRKRVGPPQQVDWEKAEIFVKFLRVFYDVTMRLSATKRPTAHKAFHDIVAIEGEIDALFVPEEMIDGSETTQLMLEMAVKMRSKFSKYFGAIEDMNQLLLVALVLNPRFKLKNIAHICLHELKYSSSESKAKANAIKELLVSLTDIYRTSTNASSLSKSSKSSTATSVNVGSTRATAESSSKSKTVKPSGKMADMLAGWQKALAESDEVVVESEVDRYLLDPIECPPPEEADSWRLLNWWKLNGCKYPNLALVAKDVLAIQVSTVASESSFSTGGRVVDPFRSSLTPKTVEALICLQNWIKKKDQSDIEYYPSQEELEFYEKMEKDAKKQKAKEKLAKGKGKGKVVVESEDEVEIVASKKKKTSGAVPAATGQVIPAATVRPVHAVIPPAAAVPAASVGTSNPKPPPKPIQMMLASKKKKGRR